MFPPKHQRWKVEGDYSSSPKIWEDKADFDAKVDSFAKASTDAKGKIKDLDSLKVTFAAIGKECSGCHETFASRSADQYPERKGRTPDVPPSSFGNGKTAYFDT